jgi:hypothetical protein
MILASIIELLVFSEFFEFGLGLGHHGHEVGYFLAGKFRAAGAVGNLLLLAAFPDFTFETV